MAIGRRNAAAMSIASYQSAREPKREQQTAKTTRNLFSKKNLAKEVKQLRFVRATEDEVILQKTPRKSYNIFANKYKAVHVLNTERQNKDRDFDSSQDGDFDYSGRF